MNVNIYDEDGEIIRCNVSRADINFDVIQDILDLTYDGYDIEDTLLLYRQLDLSDLIDIIENIL